ncbi:MAG: hypothetical protein FJX60_14160 [Alphaproteobacteria bacterium]|nr:hypothetical protein [Alphaproteobacteria bacterium]
MIGLEKNLLDKILHEVGTRPGIDPLAFEARVWRAVAAHVPGLSADETAELSQRIVRAYRKTVRGPSGQPGRPQPRQAA